MLGRFLFPEEQSWDKGQPRPCQAQPRGSWVPQIRQAPNVSSCWAGKMILNNSPKNRLRRGGTEQEGLSGPFLQGGVRAGSQCDVLPERRQEMKQLCPLS